MDNKYYVYEWFNEKIKRLKGNEDYENKLAKKDELIKTANETAKTASAEVVRKETEIQKLLTKNADQKAQIERLTTENASLMEFRDLIALLLEKLKSIFPFVK